MSDQPVTDPTANNPANAAPPADPPAADSPPAGSSPPAGDAPPSNTDGTVPVNGGGAAQAAPDGGAPPPGEGEGEGEGDGEGAGKGDPTAPPAHWPAAWRDFLSGGDAKLLAKLNRYDSPTSVFKAHMALERKMSSGDLIAAKPDGTDEVAMKEWRAMSGVPENAQDYLDDIPGGLVIGEADQPYINTFVEKMHAADMHPLAVHTALEWWHENEAQMAADRVALDGTERETCEAELSLEYGPDLPRFKNAVKGMFDLHGKEGLYDQLMTGRMADGQAFGSNTDAMKFLTAIALQLNPSATGTITPAVGKTRTETIATEKAALIAESAETNGPYWKGPEAKGKQARLLELNQMEVDDEARGRK